ncbi:MAG: L-asparaginase / beta-aspartyl-peptidase [Solirubrobacteraceae bacterium]|jgi:isoaspartyl peptidase/L-asparaginase-like protein (Ntn-hydrolase superfamily)|nr:L-asparaginase / beta-aspartyl-peptidase [Solirubrobacteraceae bacterium]
MAEVAIVVHGGAGRLPTDAARIERMRAGARDAVEAGHAALAAGASALDAVELAVAALEDDPVFNAGRGAALTEDGGVELDAAVMEGTDRAAGSVACLRGVRNPLRAARAVLGDGRHVMLVGEAAHAFARAAGIELRPEEWFVTDAQRAVLAAGSTGWAAGTVGAVARDARGRLAAGTSTGGTMGQRRGRVGDSPLIGAGTWADDATAAVSCTGDGEAIIRAAVAHEVDALMRHGGRGLEDACAAALDSLADRGGHGGLIAVSADAICARFSSPSMTRGWRVGDGPIETAVGG